MNILLVKSSDSIGGAEVLNLNLIKGFKRYHKNIKIFFITSSDKFSTRISDLGVESHTFNIYKKELGIKRDFLEFLPHCLTYFFAYLKKIIFLKKSEKIDLVVFQTTTEKIILTFILKLLNFKIIWFEHGPFFKTGRSAIILILYRILSNLPEFIIVVSERIKNDLVNGGVDPAKIKVISTGIDTSSFKPLTNNKTNKIRKRYGIGNQETIVGYLGSITKGKGIEDFINIADLITRKYHSVRFLIVGEGSYLEKAIYSVKKKKLTNSFVFVGFKDDVKLFLGIFDIFFFPTLYKEGIPLSVLEAMGMAKTVFARTIGGNKDLIINNKTGFLFSKETNKEITDKIIYLLKHPEVREKIGKNARGRVIKHFNYKDWIDNMYKAFKECVKDEKN